jgi:hypothetical protein
MTRVFICCSEPIIQDMLVHLCLDEGHQVIGIVPSADQALQVLRTTPHPVVAVVAWDYVGHSPQFPLFPTIGTHSEWYGRHRYVTICWSPLPDDERDTLKKLDAVVVQGPFGTDALFDAVAKSADLLPA